MRVYAPEGAELISVVGDVLEVRSRVEDYEDLGYAEDAFLQNIEGRALVDEYSGTRITREFGKAVFGNYILVEAGEEREIVFTYRLPAKTNDDYALTVQRQPGIENELHVRVNDEVLYNDVLTSDITLRR